MELLQLLLEEGCSTAHSNTYTGTSALHTAVKKRCIEVVNMLLEYGADPLLIDKVRCCMIFCVNVLFVCLW